MNWKMLWIGIVQTPLCHYRWERSHVENQRYVLTTSLRYFIGCCRFILHDVCISGPEVLVYK
jgi:hypothetical protein